jgi:hypothetical protein
MSELQPTKADVSAPAPSQIEVRLGKKIYHLAYVPAFALAYALLKQGQCEDAATLFERLKAFTDQGPKALIMEAFCHAATLHFSDCGKPLGEIFNGERQHVAAELHNAFVSFHVGIRQDALTTMIDLVNKHPDLPTLCLLLGDMFAKTGQVDMARTCWKMAVKRDHLGGAVAVVASRQLKRGA